MGARVLAGSRVTARRSAGILHALRDRGPDTISIYRAFCLFAGLGTPGPFPPSRLLEAGGLADDTPIVQAADWLLRNHITGGGDWRPKKSGRGSARAGRFEFSPKKKKTTFLRNVDDTGAFVLMAFKKDALAGYPDGLAPSF